MIQENYMCLVLIWYAIELAILNPLDLNQLFHTDKIKASGLGQIFSMRLDGSSSVYHESSVVASKKDSRYNASTIFTNSQMICFLNICPNQMTPRNEFSWVLQGNSRKLKMEVVLPMPTNFV